MILYYLTKQIDLQKESPIEDKQSKGASGSESMSNDATPHILYNYVSMKELFLNMLITFMSSKKLVFKQQQELEEYSEALQHLSNLGITNVNEGILLVYQ